MNFPIEIKHQLILCSKRLKTTLVVPGTSTIATIYPGYMEFYDLVTKEASSIDIPIQGPVSNFLVKIIVSKKSVEISFHDQTKFFRYHLFCSEGLVILEEKKPKRQRLLSLLPNLTVHSENIPRLFLGSTKAQDIEAIWKRGDLREFLPYLLALSALSPKLPLPRENAGTYSLLRPLIDQSSSKSKLQADWATFVLIGFYEMFVPTANDLFHQGCTESISEDSSLPILSSMQSLITSLFVTYENGVLTFLPTLFSPFICGKLTHVEFEFGRVDFEWTKRKVQRIVIYSKEENVLKFQFPKEATKYRLMIGRQKKKSTHQADDPLKIRAACEYRLEIE